MKYKKTLLILLLLSVVAGLFGIYKYSEYQKESEKKLAQESLFGWKFPVVGFPDTGPDDSSLLAYSSIRDPGGVPRGLPVRLKIPAIGVDTAIEDALITPDGRMDVPAGSINVAWFALGPSPGKIGSSVIGGHFGIDNGVPKVFYNLDKLKIGDLVQIVNDRGETLSFIVRSTKSFNRDDDATTVFTSQDGLAHLNLITCEGLWNQVDDSYPQRLVVFTDLIPNLPSTAETEPTTSPLATLQPSAPPLVVSPTPTTEVSPTPTDLPNPDPENDNQETVENTTPTFRQDLPNNIKILFAHPIDAGITVALLGLIAVLVFKIIRK